MGDKLRDPKAWVHLRVRPDVHQLIVRLREALKEILGEVPSEPTTIGYAVTQALKVLHIPTDADMPVKRMSKAEIEQFKTRQVSLALEYRERQWNAKTQEYVPAGFWIIEIEPKTQRETCLVGPYPKSMEVVANTTLQKLLSAPHLKTALVEARDELWIWMTRQWEQERHNAASGE